METNTQTNSLPTQSLPQSKFYQQWRNGRAVIFVCIMASVFMLGGIMTNLILLAQPIAAYAVALATFFATAGLYMVDSKATGFSTTAKKSDVEFMEIPSGANDSGKSRKAA